jgi:phosphoglycerol transferase
MLSLRLLLACLLLPSVFLSHSASIDSPVWLAIPGALSVLLLILAVTEIYARTPAGLLRFVVGFLMLTPVAIYLFAQLLSYELQGSYFNQRFFFHFNLNTLITAGQAFTRVILIFALWMLSLWLILWRYARYPFQCQRISAGVVSCALLLAVVTDPGLFGSTRDAIAFNLATEEFVLENTDWEGLNLNAEALGDTAPAGTAGKNLLLIYLEGLENIYTDESLFPGLTPNLARLSEQGQRLNNVSQSLGTGWTIAGMTASHCGTPLLYYADVNGNEVDFSSFLANVRCTSDLLNAAGYEQTYMGGADIAFANKGRFLSVHGYDRVLGRNELGPLLTDPEKMGGWGLYDEDLFDLAVDEFDRLAQSGQAFALTLLTVDTHHPVGEPSPSCTPYENIDNSILHAVHCSDQLIGKFMDSIQSHPAYAETVVVLMSDHLGMRNAAFELFPPDYPRKLFFLALNHDRPILQQDEVSHMDIAATLPSLLEMEHNLSFLAGFDLTALRKPAPLDSVARLQQEHAIATINSSIFSP